MKGKDIDNLENILLDLEDVENGAMINLSQEEINSLESILETLKSSISKDKIREKIKELEALYNCNLDTALTSYEMFTFVRSYIDKVKNILNELLEDN